MCGISGFINTLGRAVEETHLHAMLRAQEHRGPDNSGIYYNQTVGLAHNRLSLQDLSANGNQPFEDESHALIFNGEIYNFNELRKVLPPKSYKSTSDTEVLFHALKCWGMDKTLKALRGMFAFAWYDKRTADLILARDRVGIKPLFYGIDQNGTYWFASELKAIRSVLDGKPNPIKVLYSGLGILEKSRFETAWDNIFHVRPGQYVHIDHRGHRGIHYFDIQDTVKESEYRRLERSRFEEVLAEFGTLFDASIQRMLISDAPMGAYVSGGIDSSLIAVHAARHQSNLKLFTANILGKYSEFQDAQNLAVVLGSPLHDYKFDKEMALRDWARVTWHYESPLTVHFNAIPFSNVSALARRENVKAVLTGEGSDELFLGYPKLLTRRYDALIRSPLKLIEAIYGLVPGLRNYVTKTGGSGDLLGLFELASQNFTRQILRVKGIPSYGFLPEEEQKEQYLTAHMMQEGIVSLLWRNDRMGMMNSIEARFPFLDEDVIAFAMNLPVKFKMGLTGRFHNYKHPFLIDKYIVRKLAEKHLPDNLTYKSKNGFPLYGLRHVKAQWEIFRDGYVAEILKLDQEQLKYLCSTTTAYNVALLVAVEIWARMFMMNESVETVDGHIQRYIKIQ